jgi:hypothetical protein
MYSIPGLLPAPLEWVHAGDGAGGREENTGCNRGTDPRIQPGNQPECGNDFQERGQHDEKARRAKTGLVEKAGRALNIAQLRDRMGQEKRPQATRTAVLASIKSGGSTPIELTWIVVKLWQ